MILDLQGVIYLKINNVRVPIQKFYIVAPLNGTNHVKLELRSIFFKAKVLIEITPEKVIQYKTPVINSTKPYNLQNEKEIYYRRKLRFLLKNKNIESNTFTVNISPIKSSKVLSIKQVYNNIRAGKKLTDLSNSRNTLNKIIEQYG
ncbi:hypothetical protein [Tamlana flava]|uniref:hypothetical protein n=1 Tax=Tamlana flava TaxID=3158572 RepID=UPI00351ABD58